MQIYFSPYISNSDISLERGEIDSRTFHIFCYSYPIFLTKRTKKSDFNAANFYYFAYKYLSIEDASRRTNNFPSIRPFHLSESSKADWLLKASNYNPSVSPRNVFRGRVWPVILALERISY